MNQHEENGFSYSYSAKEQAELKRIREKYLEETAPREFDKMEQVRRLDASVTKSASIISLCLGIVSTLIMGFGMSLIMSDLKDSFALSGAAAMIVGILISLVGMLGVFAAYPLYHSIVAKKQKKIAPEILRLTEELLNEGK